MHNSKVFRLISDDDATILGDCQAATNAEAARIGRERFGKKFGRAQGPKDEPSLAALGLRRKG